MTVMGDALVDGLSDAGSTPARSIWSDVPDKEAATSVKRFIDVAASYSIIFCARSRLNILI